MLSEFRPRLDRPRPASTLDLLAFAIPRRGRKREAGKRGDREDGGASVVSRCRLLPFSTSSPHNLQHGEHVSCFGLV